MKYGVHIRALAILSRFFFSYIIKLFRSGRPQLFIQLQCLHLKLLLVVYRLLNLILRLPQIQIPLGKMLAMEVIFHIVKVDF